MCSTTTASSSHANAECHARERRSVAPAVLQAGTKASPDPPQPPSWRPKGHCDARLCSTRSSLKARGQGDPHSECMAGRPNSESACIASSPIQLNRRLLESGCPLHLSVALFGRVRVERFPSFHDPQVRRLRCHGRVHRFGRGKLCDEVVHAGVSFAEGLSLAIMAGFPVIITPRTLPARDRSGKIDRFQTPETDQLSLTREDPHRSDLWRMSPSTATSSSDDPDAVSGEFMSGARERTRASRTACSMRCAVRRHAAFVASEAAMSRPSFAMMIGVLLRWAGAWCAVLATPGRWRSECPTRGESAQSDDRDAWVEPAWRSPW
jgi:hypothetical protein